MATAAVVGQRVYTPRTALTNGGVDFSVGFVTEAGTTGGGPNGGTIVNVQVMANTALSILTYESGLEMMDYEGDARNLGVGAGAWPCDDFL